MKKGILVFRGKTLEPPYIMRQEADKIFVNDQQIYPFPEIEKPEEKPLFKAEPEVPEFKLPENIQETLDDFQKSWASGLVSDAKEIVKKGAGLEREEDFIKDKTGAIMDADAFIQDYQFQKQALEEILKSEGISFVETEKYNDILIPVEKEWGVVALFNEAERLKVTAEIDKERPVPRRYSYTDAAKFKEYIETGLQEGDMIVMDDDFLEFIPRDSVDEAAKEISGFDGMSTEGKAGALGEKLSLDLSAPPSRIKSAVIFFPHLSWQREVVGRYSRYPLSLAQSLRRKRYRVWVFLDKKVSLRTWAKFMKEGKSLNLKVIYNQGHGNDNVIDVGEPDLKRRWFYFNDQFVYKHAHLYNTIVFIHSCATLSDKRLASAFLRQRACTYGGWEIPTSANPEYCDRCDGIFWRPLVTMNAATGVACRALNSFDSKFKCLGSSRCRLR